MFKKDLRILLMKHICFLIYDEKWDFASKNEYSFFPFM